MDDEALKIAIRHKVNDAFQYGEETKGLADYKTINTALNLTTDQIMQLIKQDREANYLLRKQVETALQAAEKGSASPGRDNACAEIRAQLGLEKGKKYA